MKTHYSDSWGLYKAHSEIFKVDLNYYLNFCKGFRALDLFAGYGRLTNRLIEEGIDVESVELESTFSEFINLPKEKKHVCSVLEFTTIKPFERVIAGYNSFCLLKKEEEIRAFFSRLHSWLTNDGLASISYYHTDFWSYVKGYSFEHNGNVIKYQPYYDLSEIDKGRGVWVDEYYEENGVKHRYEYPVRVYQRTEDLQPFIKDAGLKLVEVIYDYNEPNLPEPGWIEFVLKKEE